MGNKSSRLLTGAEAKAQLHANGYTLKRYARENNFKYRTVSDVIREVNKGLYGEGHRVAVALGMKKQTSKAA